MRRGPQWFIQSRSRERFHQLWPWALGGVCATLYFFNREPFEEMAGTVVTKIRKPLLKTMEWIELHDVDPETMALELPPDVLFGPLEFSKQMRFLMAALRADNELADGYLARVLVDHMDLSLDPPLLTEKEILETGGRQLLDFAIEDFLGAGSRKTRKHIFFRPDQFLRLINFLAVYPSLTNYFVKERNGVDMIFRALRHSSDEFARVLALRSLCLFCFTQCEDGDVERRIMQANGVEQIVKAYKQSTGDPTDTRYITLLISSLLRHYPLEGGKEFIEADGIQAAVDNLNIARYKGIPQHVRVLHDAKRLPPAAIGGRSINSRIEDADFIPIAMGLLDAFPEFYEASSEILLLLRSIVPSCASPFNLLEYHAMPILSKYYVRWQNDTVFRTDGTLQLLVELFKLMLEDPTCQRCFDPSVASYELQECLRTARAAIEAESSKPVVQPTL
ncbi:hypothetical protein, conserved [Trypanosoma brucei gambiense DAL972]|uniref:Uncharacterized protein n=1 Tax=Trypanosoma brucei gambiense (strain MHOM/CI/86/DAL972) TaxID=679716 RepID=D0A2Q6_TRYB9|nr:hypothetical protein, conserved [Trypanosoma brucei gambiense DAL972]CBH15550.1 hypothetical protein, conserved [Trypanosoma brucei gambiense DAL972]|eukprot:XP_011777814.1 hypothetical protein, conserved [Trypanosoma brucei gambiense DAL972]